MFFLFIQKKFSKNEVKNLIEWFLAVFGSIRTMKLLDKLKMLGFKFQTDSGLSLGFNDLLVPFSLVNILRMTEFLEHNLSNKFINYNLTTSEYILKRSECWNLASESIKTDILKTFSEINLLNPLYMMVLSGARGNITQIKQLVGIRGLMMDSQGHIVNVPIKSNLKKGLRSLEYFISCYGARKGVIDTALKTANSGYLTRKLIYVSENQFVKIPSCNTNNCQLIYILKTNKRYYLTTYDRLLGRVLAKNIIAKDLLLLRGQDICNYIVKKLMSLRKVYIRSPFTCTLNEGICQLCYGWNLSYSRMIELGENVGVIAAQSISEPATQLTMRTFHTGGIFSGSVAEVVRVNSYGIIYYNISNGGKILKTINFEKCFLTLKKKNIFLVSNSRKRLVINLPSYSIIYVRNGDRVFPGQVVAELTNWRKVKNSFSLPSKRQNKVSFNSYSFISGIIKNFNGNSVVLQGNILNFSNLFFIFSLNYFKKIINFLFDFLVDVNFSVIERSFLNKKKFEVKFSVKIFRSLFFLNKMYYRKKDILINFHNIFAISFDNVLLNKIKSSKFLLVNKFLPCNTFVSNNSRTMHDFDVIYSFHIFESQSSTLSLFNARSIMFRKLFIDDGLVDTFIKKGDKVFSSMSNHSVTGDIVQGLPAIESILENRIVSDLNFGSNSNKSSLSQIKLDSIYNKYLQFYSQKLAVRKSVYRIQKYLVNKIKRVYTQQNVKVSDKHLEIVVRQMTSKVIIRDEGESNFIKGELVSLSKLEKINSNLSNKIVYFPLIIGITKLSLFSDSFLVSSSFQQTFYTICGAALESKCDWLHTLKGNIIIGNLVPILTGYKKNHKYKGV